MAEEFEPTLQKKERESKDYYEQPLALCIAQAEQSYEKYWFRECKSQGLLTKSCIEINEMPFEEYAKENNIPDLIEFGKFYGENKFLVSIEFLLKINY